MLSNYQLMIITSNHECTQSALGGVYSFNLIPSAAIKFPSFWICNNKDSNQPGEHWFSCYFQSESSPAEFFCSFGKSPSDYSSQLEYILKKSGNGNVQYNPRSVQADQSLSCSYFCLYVVDQRCRGVSYEGILSKFSSSDLKYNDDLVVTYVQQHMR